MIIKLKKFGTLLLSRPVSKEALNALEPVLSDVNADENIEIDFSGVLTFSPSWGDEFLSPLIDRFGDRLILMPSDNLSVCATLKILQEVNKRPFNIKS